MIGQADGHCGGLGFGWGVFSGFQVQRAMRAAEVVEGDRYCGGVNQIGQLFGEAKGEASKASVEQAHAQVGAFDV